MRILLTGANGFIGQHLLQALLTEGHEVVCAVRRPPRDAGTEAHPRLRYIQADFAKDTDKSVWLARLSGVDAVVNTVGIFRESGAQNFANLHVRAPRALFAACAESDDVHMVVQLSALGADADADTPYHLSKKAADDYLARLPLRAAIVQPSLVYGGDGASTRAFKALAALPLGVRLGDAPQLVQPIHVDDVVAAIVALLRQRLYVDNHAHNYVDTRVDKGVDKRWDKWVDKHVDNPADRQADAAPDSHVDKVVGKVVDRPVDRRAAGTGMARRIALVGPQALPFSDYLAALRSAMGMRRRRTLTLPGGLARGLARMGGWLPGVLLDPDALRMLDRGSVADPGPTLRLLGRPARAIGSFITDAGAERARAKLDWLLPGLRLSIAFVWIVTAIVSACVYPADASFALLARMGIAAPLQPAMLYGACAFDLLMGLGTLLLAAPRRRWLWLAQLALIGFYTVAIALRLPEFLVHPYGPLIKNVPMLAAIWLLYELEKDET
jgi:uncharacterized protein YbjT (DUF2867 family)